MCIGDPGSDIVADNVYAAGPREAGRRNERMDVGSAGFEIIPGGGFVTIPESTWVDRIYLSPRLDEKRDH